MIDITMVDRMYEASLATFGQAPGADLMNKRVAAPLEWLPRMVKAETGEDLDEARIPSLLDAGWMPRVPASEGDGEPGVPLYLPSRIGLFLRLEREGYTSEELRALAEYEEELVDNVLAADDLAYLKSDYEVMVRWLTEQVDVLQRALAEPTPAPAADGEGVDGTPVRRTNEPRLALDHRLRESERTLENLTSIPWERRSEKSRRAWGKMAFRVRMMEEIIRLNTLNLERAKIEQGYSPMIHFEDFSSGLVDHVEFGTIHWALTIGRPWTTADGVEIPLRVPGFIVRDGRVTTSRTLVPSEYAKLWKASDLDEYISLHAKLANQRLCRHCKAQIPEDADPRKRYCDTTCQNAAKQRRWRKRNPKSYIESQRRYWSS